MQHVAGHQEHSNQKAGTDNDDGVMPGQPTRQQTQVAQIVGDAGAEIVVNAGNLHHSRQPGQPSPSNHGSYDILVHRDATPPGGFRVAVHSPHFEAPYSAVEDYISDNERDCRGQKAQ